jgi:CheY-like chemotaxis protein
MASAFRVQRVLVVDDYPDTLEMLSMAFEIAGYGVLLAHSGPEAIWLARQHRPDAVIMDIYMPEMDGILTTQQIRQDPELARIPIVAHTARPGGVKGMEGLFDAICPKPCPPDRLIDLVAATIRGSGGEEPSGPA